MSVNGMSRLMQLKFGEPRPAETEEEIVARLLKGDFERITGVSFERFCELREYLIENNPEMLI